MLCAVKRRLANSDVCKRLMKVFSFYAQILIEDIICDSIKNGYIHNNVGYKLCIDMSRNWFWIIGVKIIVDFILNDTNQNQVTYLNKPNLILTSQLVTYQIKNVKIKINIENGPFYKRVKSSRGLMYVQVFLILCYFIRC